MRTIIDYKSSYIRRTKDNLQTHKSECVLLLQHDLKTIFCMLVFSRDITKRISFRELCA